MAANMAATTGYLTVDNYNTYAIDTTNAAAVSGSSWSTTGSWVPAIQYDTTTMIKCAWCLKRARNGVATVNPFNAETFIDGTAVCGYHADQLLTIIEEEE